MTAPRDPNKHLVTARLADLVDVFKAEGIQDAAILSVSRRAAELISAEEGEALYNRSTNEQLEALGWTRQELRVAIHAIKCKSEAPAYLLMAQERHVARQKSLPMDGGGGKGKGSAFVIPVSATGDDEDEEPQP